MKLELIKPLAEELIEQLSSACVRIEIAGSIRRGKDAPNDIEVVAIPSLGTYTILDLFGAVAEEHHVNHLEDAIGTLLDLGQWEYDPVVKRDGPRYKRLKHKATGVCADLFITDREHWGVIFTIRTGPGDFSKALVTWARQLGMQVSEGRLHNHAPADYDANGKAKPCWEGDNCPRIIATPEERDFFAALGLPWMEPSRRNTAQLYTRPNGGRAR